MEASLRGYIDMERIEDIEIHWCPGRDASQWNQSRVLVDGKHFPVTHIGVDIGPNGKEYVTFTVSAYRVQFNVIEE